MLIIDIITIFPKIFDGPFNVSIIKNAVEKNIASINIHNLREWAIDKRGTVDDRPFGGGVGMVMKPEPIFKAVEDLLRPLDGTQGRPELINGRQAQDKSNKVMSKKEKFHPKDGRPLAKKVILLTPQGKLFNQEKAQELSKLEHLILICGHYEGVDERVREHLVDEEISIGDYILTGGELPATIIVDAVVRLLPGVLEKEEATKLESFQILNPNSNFPLLEYPQYTRPENYRGMSVPEVLLSGDHKKIEKWRRDKSLERTKERRPDLLRVKDQK